MSGATVMLVVQNLTAFVMDNAIAGGLGLFQVPGMIPMLLADVSFD